MKIKKARNIMGQELPIETVRTATETQAQFDASARSESQFARGVQAALAWMLRKAKPAPFDVTR